MKKLLLSIVLSLLTVISFAQNNTTDRVIKMTKMEFVDGEFVTRDVAKPKKLFINISGNVVLIGKVKYTTYGDVETDYHEGFVTFTWNCIDSDGNKGYFIMKKFSKYPEGFVMMVGFGSWLMEFLTKTEYL